MVMNDRQRAALYIADRLAEAIKLARGLREPQLLELLKAAQEQAKVEGEVENVELLHQR